MAATLLSTNDQEAACGLVTLGLDGWPPEELVSTLQERFNIVGRTVHGPDGVRFSTHFFNTASEVDKVAEVLETSGRGGIPRAELARSPRAGSVIRRLSSGHLHSPTQCA